MWVRIFSTKYDDDEWPLRLKVYWRVINFGYYIVFITTVAMGIVNIFDVKYLRFLMYNII